jgi:uncharacterized protein YjbI with pentapeptide repeats
MKSTQLKQRGNNSIVFSGNYASLRLSVEAALEAGTTLDEVDLKNANLCNSRIDGIKMRSADLRRSNLSGANISEADLDRSDFREAEFYNTCLCVSRIKGCDFRHARFGGTDITASKIDGSLFAGLSCFSLNFRETLSMDGCFYEDINANLLSMSKPPVVIYGLERFIAFLDDHLLIGNSGFSLKGINHRNYETSIEVIRKAGKMLSGLARK